MLGEIAEWVLRLRALIQRRERRTERLCPHEAGRINGSGVRGRRVREDVRVEAEWLNPARREHRACRKANLELRLTDKHRLTRVLITA